MDLALITSAAALGLAGAPHCVLMCAAPCAAATAGQGRMGTLAFHIARVASYSALGAAAAASVASLAALSAAAPVLRPLWTMLHAGAAALGLWLLWQGRQPAWLGRWGHLPGTVAAPVTAPVTAPVAAPARGVVFGPTASATSSATAAATAAGAGALWAFWPCALLQSAVLVAALGSGPAAGAGAMAAFAVASSPGLLLGPWAWRRWLSGAAVAARQRFLVRLSGAVLAAASLWAVSHQLLHRVALWCGLG